MIVLGPERYYTDEAAKIVQLHFLLQWVRVAEEKYISQKMLIFNAGPTLTTIGATRALKLERGRNILRP